jgi:hypothetical protein
MWLQNHCFCYWHWFYSISWPHLSGCHVSTQTVPSLLMGSLPSPHTQQLSPCHWVWWCVSVIPGLSRLRQEVCEFKTSVRYLARPCHSSNNSCLLFFLVLTGIFIDLVYMHTNCRWQEEMPCSLHPALPKVTSGRTVAPCHNQGVDILMIHWAYSDALSLDHIAKTQDRASSWPQAALPSYHNSPPNS